MPSPIFIAAVLAFLISVAICPALIKVLRKFQFGQQVREDGPPRHLAKAGTPTMGGMVFLLAALVAAVALAPAGPYLWLLILLTFGNGLIGWLDDYAKVARGRSLGLKARNKLAGQLVLAVVFAAGLYWTGLDTAVAVPFTGNVLELGRFYPLLVLVIISGTSNAVNLTDGIDGLATGTAIISLLAFTYIASTQGLIEVALFCAALVGACFGFLVYNIHPARIFMGDVGSLALGGALAGAAIITKTEFYLVIIGGVFVIETLSVILQVISYRLTGRRIFRMSPLHHHFEMRGWSEWQVVTGFWGLAFLLAVVALVELGPGLF